MRQGITTRYLGPTNSKGPRIKATARKASSFDPEMALTEPRNYGMDTDEDHTRVAHLLAVKLGWSGLWIAGGKPEEDGSMYVCLHVGPGTDLQVHMANLYSLVEGRDWFYVAPKTA